MLTAAARYLDLIEATLRASTPSRASRRDSMSAALGFLDHTLGESGPTSAIQVRVDQKFLDGAGHSRPLYRGLTLYALGRTKLLPDDGLRHLAEVSSGPFATFIKSKNAPAAADGAALVQMAFDAMAISCTDSPSPITSSARTLIEQVAARQQPDGRFLDKNASDNPEPMWYHELSLLHALTTFAYRTKSTLAQDASLKAAAYQAAQIQPDHASSHPFAMHAFLRSDDGTYLADMMLHAAGVQQPATMDSVSLLLLADALDCMRSANW